MDTFAVFQQMLILVFVIAVGFSIRRMGIINEDTNAHLTKLILSVTMPATLLSALSGSTLEVPLRNAFILLGIVTLAHLFMIAIACLSPFALRADKSDRGVLATMALFGNATFIGIPLAYAFFGPDGMFYTLLLNIVNNLFLFSLGMKLVGGSRAKLSIKFFLSPVLISAVLAVTLFLANIQLPFVINSGLRLIGSITTPAAMILLGSTLGAIEFGELFRGWRVYAITAVRLLIIPVSVFYFLVFISATIFPLSTLFLRVAIVIVASPMAVSTVTFAIHYGANKELASKGILLSTLFSVITMPFLLTVLT